MGEMTGYSLRINRDDLDRWRAAAQARNVSVSEMIRSAVENYLVDPTGAGAYQVTATSGAAVRVVPSRNTAGTTQCRNQQRHRKGQRCGYCGWTG
jgi:hypothetical protein